MNANVEDRGLKGDCTPLMEAASAGHVDIVSLLIAHGADVNAQSTSGNTPLMYGCAGGHEKVVKVLLDAGANVEDHNENGHTPLMEAASAGHVSVAKVLLEHGAGINTHSNEFKESALTLACYKGHLDMVRFLLEAGADQEHKTDEMHTALMEASMDGHVEVARLLLDSGAQVNMPTDSFESPLTLAACGGHVDLAMLLIERGANIEEVNDEGYTPLMEAAREGHEEMVALLLSQGANINAQTEETQETALTLACCGGFLEVADFLIKAGSDIELGASTPLMEAAQEGHLDLVRYLLECGATVHAQTQTGDTALTYACENGHTDVADLLLKFGANLEHESEGGRTPLMKACRAGHLCTVQFLITKCADLNHQTTNNDHTPLSLACAGGHLSVVELLLSKSADPFHKLKDNSTMLIEAAKGGHTNVVQLLLDYPHSILMSSPNDTNTSISLSQLQTSEQVNQEESLLTESMELAENKIVTRKTNKKYLLNSNKTTQHLPSASTSSGDLVSSKLCSNSIVLNEDTSFLRKISEADSSVPELSINVNVPVSLINNNDSLKDLRQVLHKEQILQELQRVERELQIKEANQLNMESAETFNDEIDQQRLSSIDFSFNCSFEQSYPTHNGSQDSTLSTNEVNLKDIVSESRDNFNIEDVNVSSTLPFYKDFHANKYYIEGFKKGIQLQKQHLLKEVQSLQNTHSSLQLSCSAFDDLTITSNLPSHVASVFNMPNTGIIDSNNMSSISAENNISFHDFCTVNSLKSVNSNNDKNQNLTLNECAKVKSVSRKDNKNVRKTVHGMVMNKIQQQHLALMAGLSSSDFQKFLEKTRPHCVQQVHQLQQLNHQLQLQIDQVQQSSPLDLNNVSTDFTRHHQDSISTFSSESSGSNIVPNQEILKLDDGTQIPINEAVDIFESINFNEFSHGTTSTACVINDNVSKSSGNIEVKSSSGKNNFVQVATQTQSSSSITISALSSEKKSFSTISSTSKGKKIKHLISQKQIHSQRSISPPSQIESNLSPQVNRELSSDLSTSATGATGESFSSNEISPAPFSCMDVDSETDSNHDTALTLACAGGHEELVELLLTRGADIEHRDKKGFTPLILAATAGHQKVVENLLNHSADIEAQSERTKDTPLSLACSGGRFEVVELLLNRGANKEHRNVSDYTPLSLAASGGYVNIIKLLLSHGAEINSRTGSKLGISPLMLAAMNGHAAAVKLLLDMGSDINAQIETNRNTALTLACFQGRHEVVSLLLDRKANVEHRAKTGLTPLMEAASGGYVEVGRVLLTKGADVNATPVPSSRDTALTIAADKGHCRFVELLLSRGTQVEVKNKKGNSPLWLAANSGHLNVVDLLFHAGADIDSQDNRKISCLMATFRKGHVKVVKWMVNHVTQFPSDQEMTRYIATINDKDLLERCQECVKVIRAAKETQAAKANKNATILLEELDMEKTREESKKAAAARRRERKKKKKIEKKEEKRKLCEENKKNELISTDEVSLTIANKKDYDQEDNNDVGSNENNNLFYHTNAISQNKLSLELVNKEVDDGLYAFTQTDIEKINDINKKHKRKERNLKNTTFNDINSIKFVHTLKPCSSISKSALFESNSISANLYPTSKNVNIPKHPAEREDFEETGKEVPTLCKRNRNSSDTCNLNSSAPTISLSCNIKQSGKRDEGWKEVVRKGQTDDSSKFISTLFRLKKVSVPPSAISRVIGRGGTNINSIRTATGAHIEIEKQSKSQGERVITIKGTLETTKQAYFLILALIKDQDADILQLLPKSRISTIVSTSSEKYPSPIVHKQKILQTKASIGITSSTPFSSSTKSSNISVFTTNSLLHRAETNFKFSSSPIPGTISKYVSCTDKKTTSYTASLLSTKTTMSYTNAIMTTGQSTKFTSSFPPQTFASKLSDFYTLPQSKSISFDSNECSTNHVDIQKSISSSSVITQPSIITNFQNLSQDSERVVQNLSEPDLSLISIESKSPIVPTKYVKEEPCLDKFNNLKVSSNSSFVDNLHTPIKTTTVGMIFADSVLSVQTNMSPKVSCTAPSTSNDFGCYKKVQDNVQLEYSLFNDVFTKFTQQSVWGRKELNTEKYNDSAAVTGASISVNTLHNNFINSNPIAVDESKAPGYRGKSTNSPILNISNNKNNFSNKTSPSQFSNTETILNYSSKKLIKTPSTIIISRPSASYESSATICSKTHVKPVFYNSHPYKNVVNNHKIYNISSISQTDLNVHTFNESGSDCEGKNINTNLCQSANKERLSNLQTPLISSENISNYPQTDAPLVMVTTTISISRLNPRAPDFSSTLHSNNKRQESLFNTGTQSTANIYPSFPDEFSANSSFSTHYIRNDHSSCPKYQSSQTQSHNCIVSNIDNCWDSLPTTHFSAYHNSILGQVDYVDNIISTNSDNNAIHHESNATVSSNISPTKMIYQQSSLRDDRKMPRPIGMERTWKNFSSNIDSGGDMDNTNWIANNEKIMSSWSDVSSDTDRDQLYCLNKPLTRVSTIISDIHKVNESYYQDSNFGS